MATPKEIAQENEQLKKENAALKEQRDGLLKRVQELEKSRPASKSRQQAEQVQQLLAAGPVTQEMLKQINPKYPSDGIYYARTLLKMNVHTVRLGEGKGTVYMNDAHFKVYEEGLAKEKAAAEAAKTAAAKEAPSAAQTIIAGKGIVHKPAATTAATA